ncbi:MAG: hypothetical protein LIO92_00905 [Clostridiales bacterium]|nr:hypothetical protein [Clostridiales bacterium]
MRLIAATRIIPLHINKGKQLRAIEQFLDREKPDKALAAQVMKECCAKYRYQFSQFKVVFDLARAGRELSADDSRAQVPTGDVSYTDLMLKERSGQQMFFSMRWKYVMMSG